MSVECPACHKSFQNEQGRGAHLRHSRDALHAEYRAKHGLTVAPYSRYPAAQTPAPPAPAAPAVRSSPPPAPAPAKAPALPPALPAALPLPAKPPAAQAPAPPLPVLPARVGELAAVAPAPKALPLTPQQALALALAQSIAQGLSAGAKQVPLSRFPNDGPVPASNALVVRPGLPRGVQIAVGCGFGALLVWALWKLWKRSEASPTSPASSPALPAPLAPAEVLAKQPPPPTTGDAYWDRILGYDKWGQA